MISILSLKLIFEPKEQVLRDYVDIKFQTILPLRSNLWKKKKKKIQFMNMPDLAWTIHSLKSQSLT